MFFHVVLSNEWKNIIMIIIIIIYCSVGDT